ncbi:hypothetical protein [Streptomyces goshikiensis]|uniref:hypothetical protein n=1 Tax=Streptomyces goshikiensis TaxID=1942 RepID=UPI0036BE3782
MKFEVHAAEWREPPEPKYGTSMVGALLREREEYVRRNLPDRVRQVDEQLALHGHVAGRPQRGVA